MNKKKAQANHKRAALLKGKPTNSTSVEDLNKAASIAQWEPKPNATLFYKPVDGNEPASLPILIQSDGTEFLLRCREDRLAELRRPYRRNLMNILFTEYILASEVLNQVRDELPTFTKYYQPSELTHAYDRFAIRLDQFADDVDLLSSIDAMVSRYCPISIRDNVMFDLPYQVESDDAFNVLIASVYASIFMPIIDNFLLTNYHPAYLSNHVFRNTFGTHNESCRKGMDAIEKMIEIKVDHLVKQGIYDKHKHKDEVVNTIHSYMWENVISSLMELKLEYKPINFILDLINRHLSFCQQKF